MSIDDIFYSDQEGKYVRIDGEKTSLMKESDGPGYKFKNKTSGTTGSIYFRYTDKAGRSIPLKMNTAKIGSIDGMDHAESIFNNLVKFYENGNLKDYRVGKTGINALDKQELTIQQYLNFYLKERKNKATDIIFLKNTFALYSNDAGQNVFSLYDENTKTGQITSLDALLKNKAEIIKALKNSRMNINKDNIIDEKGLNKEMLSYMFDNNII